MKATKKTYVTFYSPGTLFAESSSYELDSRDTRKAVEMAETVVERYGAKPYAFRFETRMCAPDIDDGAGGVIRGAQKTIDETGYYFLGGNLETYHEIEWRNDPSESILLSNMRCNDWPIVCVNTNSWKSVQPFGDECFIVGPDGAVVERGDDPRHVAYRADTIRELKARS
jgi:hypothetical protein